MPADYKKIERLLDIITTIQAEKGINAKRLAEKFGVDERSIYRDVKCIKNIGIPFYHDKETGGYQIRRDFFMPPVSLTLDESLALIALAKYIGDDEQVPMTKSAGKAITKIRTQIPAKVRNELGDLDQHISIKLAQAGPHYGYEDVWDRIQMAINQRTALECRYESVSRNLSTDEEEEFFTFKPYKLFFSQRAWYTIGFHEGRDEIRCLKLNRFSATELTKETYEIPKDFSLDDHLGNAWRMIRSDDKYDVELIFDAEFAETISDTLWHPTQEFQYHENGSITFTCQVDGLDEIVWWILSMGPHCIVNKPQELADRVKHLAQGIIEAYKPKENKQSAD